MRLRLLLCFSIGFLLNSCYRFEPLPDKYVASYEFVLPLVDTTMAISEFADIKNLPASHEITKGSIINMGTIQSTLYQNKLSGDIFNVLDRLSPHIVIDAGGLSGAEANLKIYVMENIYTKNYFWLPENYTFTVGSSKIEIPETPSDINPSYFELLKTSDKIYIDAAFTFNENVLVARLITEKINIKIGIRIKMATNTKINL